jgi:hypothetical protein
MRGKLGFFSGFPIGHNFLYPTVLCFVNGIRFGLFDFTMHGVFIVVALPLKM